MGARVDAHAPPEAATLCTACWSGLNERNCASTTISPPPLPPPASCTGSVCRARCPPLSAFRDSAATPMSSSLPIRSASITRSRSACEDAFTTRREVCQRRPNALGVYCCLCACPQRLSSRAVMILRGRGTKRREIERLSAAPDSPDRGRRGG